MVFAALAYREDHIGLLCCHPHQRSAGLFLGEQGAVDFRAVHPARLNRWQLPAPRIRQHDAGAAKGGYGFGILPDGLHRLADGCLGIAGDLDALEQHDHGVGGDDLFDCGYCPYRLAVCDQADGEAAGTKRAKPVEADPGDVKRREIKLRISINYLDILTSIH